MKITLALGLLVAAAHAQFSMRFNMGMMGAVPQPMARFPPPVSQLDALAASMSTQIPLGNGEVVSFDFDGTLHDSPEPTSIGRPKWDTINHLLNHYQKGYRIVITTAREQKDNALIWQFLDSVGLSNAVSSIFNANNKGLILNQLDALKHYDDRPENLADITMFSQDTRVYYPNGREYQPDPITSFMSANLKGFLNPPTDAPTDAPTSAPTPSPTQVRYKVATQTEEAASASASGSSSGSYDQASSGSYDYYSQSGSGSASSDGVDYQSGSGSASSDGVDYQSGSGSASSDSVDYQSGLSGFIQNRVFKPPAVPDRVAVAPTPAPTPAPTKKEKKGNDLIKMMMLMKIMGDRGGGGGGGGGLLGGLMGGGGGGGGGNDMGGMPRMPPPPEVIPPNGDGKVISFDFDGTLHTVPEPPHVGSPRMDNLRKIREYVSKGYTVIITTAREADDNPLIWTFLQQTGVAPFISQIYNAEQKSGALAEAKAVKHYDDDAGNLKEIMMRNPDVEVMWDDGTPYEPSLLDRLLMVKMQQAMPSPLALPSAASQTQGSLSGLARAFGVDATATASTSISTNGLARAFGLDSTAAASNTDFSGSSLSSFMAREDTPSLASDESTNNLMNFFGGAPTPTTSPRQELIQQIVEDQREEKAAKEAAKKELVQRIMAQRMESRMGGGMNMGMNMNMGGVGMMGGSMGMMGVLG